MNPGIAKTVLLGVCLFCLIPTALGASLKITGRVQSEYNVVSIQGLSSQSSIGDPSYYSSWGFRVSENLGNGFKAIGLIDWGFNTGNGGLFGAREQYVAIFKDSIGTFKIGRTHSPFADFAGGWTIDPFVYTALQANGSGGTMIASSNGFGSGTYAAVNSVVRFDSINFRGFSFVALLMPGDSKRTEANLGGVLGETFVNNGNTGGSNGEWDFQVAAKYDLSYHEHKFNVFGGYSRDNVSSRQKEIYPYYLKTEEVGRGGGSWSFKDFRLQGQFEYISNALGAATCSDAGALGGIGDLPRQCNSAINAGGNGTTWFTSGQYKWKSTVFIVQGGMTNAFSTSLFGGRKAKSFTVGMFHDLSKRTSLFGGYQHVHVEDRNTLDRDLNGAIGRDRSTWTAGLRHNF